MNDLYLSDIEKYLSEILSSKKDLYPEKLYSAMEYALFPAGKRIRPYLSYLTADLVGVDQEKIKPLAASIELIHNYSLIHDDLPCMDNDLVRRGKPSCFAAYGEATALLAGDCLLNLAYEILLSAVKDDPDLAESAGIIAECAGGNGMIGGQAIELTNEVINEDLVTELCKKKTGALIRAAIMSVAVLSGDRKKIAALGTYADCIGLSFQLIDDLLDKDKVEKKSYLFVMGEEKTRSVLAHLKGLVEKSLAPFLPESEALVAFSDFLFDRKY